MEEMPRPVFILSTSASDASLVSTPTVSSTQPLESKDSKQKSAHIYSHRFRYFILILGCLCLTSNCSNMITMNFTMICMFKNAPDDAIISKNLNISEIIISNVPTYYYTQSEKSMLIWAVAFGSLAATFPFSILYSKFGARYVFFAAGIISSISTLLIPFAAQLGINYLLTLRVCQGIAYAADFAAIGVLCSRWASLKQNGVFISFLTCFTPFSSSITNPVAGALCESQFGWPSVFYSHGAVSAILFICWFIFYTDNPATHRAVSKVELEKIHRNKSAAHINMEPFTPYRQILTNPVVWVVWLNALADIGSTIFLITYTPTYINNVLHYSVSKTGILGALPSILNIPFKLGSGYLSDSLKCFDERKKLIAFNSIALMIPGIMLMFLGFIPDNLPFLAVILVTLINGFLGANAGGFYKCGTLVSRQYSAFVISNIQFIKCLTLFLAPGLVAIFVTDDHNKSQWTTIFILLAGFNIGSNAIFCYFATDQPADFTNITRESMKYENALKKNTKNSITFSSSVDDNNNNNIKV